MPDLAPDTIAGLLDAIGTPHLASHMLAAARLRMPAVELFAYAGPEGAAPRPLLSHGLDGQSERRARSFASHFHIADPVRDTRASTPQGGSFVRRVRTGQISRGDYRWQCFEKPGFAEKICFGWRDGPQDYVLSFYLTEPASADMASLPAFGSLCMGILLRHARQVTAAESPLPDRLESRLAIAHPALTARERRVCALLLAGATADQAGESLGISSNSVLTYRRRACARLGLASPAQLLDGILH